MPKIDRKLADTYSTVSRPVALTMIRQISHLCGWDFDTDNVLFAGRAIQNKLDATLEPGPQQTNYDVKGPADSFTRIELQEAIEENAAVTDTVYKMNSLPVFLDRNLGVSIVPAYSTMVATLNITRRFSDSVLAERWWYDMKRLATHGHVSAFYTVEYSYNVPTQFLMLLKVIHGLREGVAGYGDKFSEYLRNGFDNRATTFTDLRGEGESKSVRMGIREMQEQVSGWFEFSDAPKPEKVENSGAFDVSFSYRYNYEVPTHMVARYPVQVHQKMLPTDYLSIPPPPNDAPQRVRRSGMSVYYQQKFLAQVNPQHGRHLPLYKFPAFDEWTPPSRYETQDATVTLFTALLSIDSSDPRHLLSFDDLSVVAEFSESLKTWFLQYREQSLDSNRSPVFLELYKDNVRYAMDKWSLDEDAQFVTEDEVNLRSTYRIRVALQQDLTKLQAETVEALCYHPDLVGEIFDALSLPKKDRPIPGTTKKCYSYHQLIHAFRSLQYTPDWFRRRKAVALNVLIGNIIGVRSWR